jgi:hypothetical protein
MDPATQFLKVMMIDEPEILDKAIARIPAEVKEKYTVLKSAPYFLEILDKRVNKGTGVKSLADALGIKPEEIMALGDQENDIAMIEFAGMGVAMDNAIPSVKEVANFVTKSNLEDGGVRHREVCAAVTPVCIHRPRLSTGAFFALNLLNCSFCDLDCSTTLNDCTTLQPWQRRTPSRLYCKSEVKFGGRGKVVMYTQSTRTLHDSQ